MAMGREMSYMQYWIETAPAPYIFPRKPSNAPRLETIIEEGSGRFDDAGKRVLYLLPVFLSVASYVLINRYIVI